MAGFGLVELLVSISIMLLVSVVIFTRQDAFNSAILLRSEAYAIALRIREVQLSAVSAVGQESNFRQVYGLYFSSAAGGNTTYAVFQDLNNNNLFDSGERWSNQGSIDRRFVISEIRTDDGSGTFTTRGALSVLFERPNFDAQIADASGLITPTPTRVEIDVTERAGGADAITRTIEITRAGQVSVLAN
jgi:type II secretory pathway pseudopilin PulG